MNLDLQYCLEYAGNFPNDRKTAVNFIERRIAQRAMRSAYSDVEYDAILNCHLAAHDLLRTE